VLDEKFHHAAFELHEALCFAYSEQSDGQSLGAFGDAVTKARAFIAAHDALPPRGRYEMA
jgi:hypothetical protein